MLRRARRWWRRDRAAWHGGPVVAFDTETTGVDVRHDRIVSAAVVRRDARGTVVRTWLVDPGRSIPALATAVHGITTEHARTHGRDARAALDELATALAEALVHGEPVVAFNAAFDLSLLEAELHRHGLPTLEARAPGSSHLVLDPWVLDRSFDRHRPGTRRLADLCAHYGVPTHGLHTAEGDALAALGLLDAVVGRFPTVARRPLGSLHRLQAATHRRRARAYRRRHDLAPPGTDEAWPVARPLLEGV
ncbi:DNA polymerase III subunit epsilon [Cellulomonas sp. APG4]|nr:exonuclease domain-containing protein [Cellulomonas sp. APG4]NCT89628.1 DNA polymerase III subunit epsilon [Cellulomonas sp. APG4]